jgi:Flp pilus assembly protein TadD
VARVHANLGAVLGKLGRFDEAEAEAKESIALRPSAPAYSNLGTLQYLRGRFADAATTFEKATALRPKDPGLFVNLGDALTQIPDRESKALAAYHEAIRLGKQTFAVNPNDGDALALVALSEARTGHIEEGWQKARQAVLLAPTNSIVLYRAALVANLAKKKPDALRLLKEALKNGYAAVQLEHEPAFADLAGNAEFQGMLKGRGGQP